MDAFDKTQTEIDQLKIAMEKTVCPLLVCLAEDMCMGIAADERDDSDREKISLYGQAGGANHSAPGDDTHMDVVQLSKMKHDIYVEDRKHPDGKRPVSITRQGRLKPNSQRNTSEMGGLRLSSNRPTPELSLIPDPSNRMDMTSNPDEQIVGPKKIVLEKHAAKISDHLPTIAQAANEISIDDPLAAGDSVFSAGNTANVSMLRKTKLNYKPPNSVPKKKLDWDKKIPKNEVINLD